MAEIEEGILPEAKFTNLNEVLDEKAQNMPDKVFIKYEDKTLTFSEFQDKVLRLANVFQSMGATKGDFIGIQTTNSIEFCICIYACYRIGAVATPIISLWMAREVAEAIQRAKIELFVVKASITSVAKKAAKTPPIKSIIVIGESNEYAGTPQVKGEFWNLIVNAEASDPKIELQPSDLASCHFTSGTTGHSKGVLHDHAGYVYAGRVLSATFGLTESDYSALVLPMYHIFGFIQLSSTVFVGATIRMLDKFDPQVLLGALEDPDLTLFCGVPSIFKMLMAQENVESFTVSPKNRLFISGAGALPAETEQDLNERLLKGHGKVCQGYGGTEDTCVGTSTASHPVLGSIGIPEPGVEIEYVDDEGNILPLGKDNIGELVNKGPHIMIGYLGDPKADDPVDHKLTDPVLKPIQGREGIWYWSGDVGYRDENGDCYLTDRSKDIAKVSERIVYPSEVEVVLGNHPGVKEIAVVGVPHKIYGEQLLAVVVPTADYKESKEILEQELKELAENELAKYKVPRIWWFKNQLLTNSLGKVLKKEYREQFNKQQDKGEETTE
ncbi:MAG TPA: class I adenylate-forming enzyme family protein [Candidatus Lokiarchaeia archaeon]|nr:class I adenylate-forming enzyme family protein [Candidatus Lokiarchaeia archaeon]